jgi:hypothetical protein
MHAHIILEYAPDLAGLVDDDRMSENEAIAALDDRKRKDAQVCDDGKAAALRIVLRPPRR